MDERPFPHRPLPQPPPSRRGFLVVAGLALVSAGAGVWRALATDGTAGSPESPTVSARLRAAAAEERDLIARVDAAAAHPRGHGAALHAVRADHVAHLAAIEALIADLSYPVVPSSAPTTGSASHRSRPTTRVSVADVRAAETGAARTAAGHAAALSGRAAVLLASISAAEATHAELLS